MAIKKNYLIEKRNVLNEMRSNNMSLQELRFFSIYLSKINARDVSTRVVRFAMGDFQRIMDLGRVNPDYLMTVTNSLLRKVVNIPSETGGYKAFQIFKECQVEKDANNEWFVEIDAHDNALPLMFEFKDRYFTYELWNALSLKSSNQLRMYELLKQFEKLGERTITLTDLKELLGLNKDDYPRYDNFKMRVLDGCQEALEIYTDIKFTYEPIKKSGRGRQVTGIKFTISRNDNYVDPLSLADFIDLQNTQNDIDNNIVEFQSEPLDFMAGACDNEFTEAEIQILYNLLTQILPHKVGGSVQDYQIRAYDHLKHRYDELKLRATRTNIKNRFGYLKKLLEADRLVEN
jgi:hypothetical protein